MAFKAEILVNEVTLSELDDIFINSDQLNILPLKRLKVNGKTADVKYRAEYKIDVDQDECKLAVQEISSVFTRILISYDYTRNKLKSAKVFEQILWTLKGILNREKITHSVISNSASQYYAQRLYPKFQQYEIYLRKLIYIALSPLENEIRESLRDTKDMGKVNNLSSFSKLEQLGMSELHFFIFELNINPIKDYTIYFKGFDSKEESEVKKLIADSLPVNIWERYFSKFLVGTEEAEVVLVKKYKEIVEYRNGVMHFHPINYKYYQKASNILSAAIKELEVIEENMLQRWNRNYLSSMLKSLQYAGVFANLSSLSNVISKALEPHTAMIRTLQDSLSPMVEAAQQINSTYGKLFATISQTIPSYPKINDFSLLNYDNEDDEESDGDLDEIDSVSE